MSPTGFMAAFITALIPVVGAAPTFVHWRRMHPPLRRWTAPFTGGAEWDLQVIVKDAGGWGWWSPVWHLDEALFAVAPDDLPAEYVRVFAESHRQGAPHPWWLRPWP